MKVNLTAKSERGKEVSKSGNEYIEMTLKGANRTEIVSLVFKIDGAGYSLQGYTHENKRIDFQIGENVKGKCDCYLYRVIGAHDIDCDSRKGKS